MKAVEEKLWVKTRVGGLARYENDYYHRVSNDIAAVPGNPWFICTLWLADYFITRATTTAELKVRPADLRVDGVARARIRHPRRAGQPLHERSDQRQPADVEPRDGRLDGDQVPGKTRAAAAVQQLQPAGLPAAPRGAGRGEEPGDVRSVRR
jgi:hypothetical protein